MNTIQSLKSIMIISLLTASSISFGKDNVIPYSELPIPIKTYINSHFPNYKVLKVETDNDLLSKEYEIKLSKGIEIEFNGKKNVIKNIGGDSKLPDNVIPLKIRQYVKSNYPKSFIKEWDLENTYQSVKLNNDIELKFTMGGDFIKADD